MKLPEARQCLMNMKKMIKAPVSYAANERGNAMMLSLMIVVCFIFLAFVFFDVFSTYAYKNASQKAADAAAIAAASEAKDIYEEELVYQLELAFAPFATGLREATQNDEENEQEEEKSSEEAEVSAQSIEEGNSPSEENTKDDEASSNEEELRDAANEEGAPESVIDKIIDASVPLTNEALLFFFTDSQITNMVCGSIKDNWSQIEGKANYFAQKNGTEDIIEMEFPYEGSFEIYVSVRTEASSFITVPDEAFTQGQRDMYTEASARVPLPKGVSFVPGACH